MWLMLFGVVINVLCCVWSVWVMCGIVLKLMLVSVVLLWCRVMVGVKCCGLIGLFLCYWLCLKW